MRKGRNRQCQQVPVRTRRRQSDAKWRASVASCYETLKFIIPNGKAMPKRKASKSLILQETEKHIGNLERAISRLLNVEAQDQGHGVLWKKGSNWSPATLGDLQEDFARQQRDIFHQSSQGRRCYNMLQDIQEDILNLSVDADCLAFLPLSPHTSDSSDKNTKDAATCTTRRHRVSKARCRFEAERASQRILAAYQTGDLVDAVVPQPLSSIPTTATATCTTTTTSSSTSSLFQDSEQAVPTTPLVCQTPSRFSGAASLHGRSLKLQKFGNVFVSSEDGAAMCLEPRPELEYQGLSGLERMVVKRPLPLLEQHSLQEVPVLMTPPGKDYLIGGDDVMMSQEAESQLTPADLLVSSTDSATTSSILTKRRVKQVMTGHSNVCKKLDFSLSSPELLFGNKEGKVKDTCFSSILTASGSGFTPLKSLTSSAGESPHTTCSGVLSCLPSFSPTKGLESYISDAALSSPTSVWALTNSMDARVPQAGLSDLEGLADLGGDPSLLCLESFDTEDITPDLKTPQKPVVDEDWAINCYKTGRKRCKRLKKDNKHSLGSCGKNATPKCRKSLEGAFEKQETAEPDSGEGSSQPVIAGLFDANTDWSDFDGYLLYYQQVAPTLRRQLGLGDGHDAPALASLVSSLWSQLPTDDRHTMATLAALDNQDSNSSNSGSASLSQDLEDVNVTPIA